MILRARLAIALAAIALALATLAGATVDEHAGLSSLASTVDAAMVGAIDAIDEADGAAAGCLAAALCGLALLALRRRPTLRSPRVTDCGLPAERRGPALTGRRPTPSLTHLSISRT